MKVACCAWCGRVIYDPRARFCSQKCRQAAHRVRLRRRIDVHDASPLRLAYADPPYPGLADYYADQPDYDGEVDHEQLVASLTTSYDGWALSTSSAALRQVLPLCPPTVRVLAWVKPNPVPPATYGLHARWEPLIVCPARRLRPGRPDWLLAAPAKGGGADLVGRKPERFCVWLFEVLGAAPGDSLEDLYPGTGIVSRVWRTWSAPSPGSHGDASSLERIDASSPAANDE